VIDALRQPASSYINGRFVPIEGNDLVSTDPADPDRIIWQGSPQPAHVDDAISAARAALDDWSSRTVEQRAEFLRRWQEVVGENVELIAGVITDDMGKTLAESRAEATLLATKVDITLGEFSMRRVHEYRVEVTPSRAGYCRFKPYGVMAVLGPFNFPAHLPNGHFVPALLMGNTVVFKPSKRTPAVGQLLAELMDEAGLPPGVFNVVHGGRGVAPHLVSHDDIDGVLLTGSWDVGRRIMEANLDRPGRIMALEMGGNNPAVVMDDCTLKQAVVECVRAGFATTGQRCTCTRRIIVQRGVADRFIPAFCKAASNLLIGPGRSKAPIFMGPVVAEDSVQDVLTFQQRLADAGGRVLLEATRIDRPGHFISPAVIEVDGYSLDRDDEVFGPLVQITIVDDIDQAITQANTSRYGLAASIFTDDDGAWEKFFRNVRAGCLNRNTGTAGASSALPFGGLGHSGNLRPAAAFSVDYCAHAVANMVEEGPDVAVPEGMHWDDRWL